MSLGNTSSELSGLDGFVEARVPAGPADAAPVRGVDARLLPGLRVTGVPRS